MELEAAPREEAVDEAVGVLDVGVRRRRPTAREVVVVGLQLAGQRERPRSRADGLTSQPAPRARRRSGPRARSAAGGSAARRGRSRRGCARRSRCRSSRTATARFTATRACSCTGSIRVSAAGAEPAARKPAKATAIQATPLMPCNRLSSFSSMSRRALFLAVALLIFSGTAAALFFSARAASAQRFVPHPRPVLRLPATLPQRTITLPILMYHLIGRISAGRAADHAAADRRRRTTSPRRCAG